MVVLLADQGGWCEMLVCCVHYKYVGRCDILVKGIFLNVASLRIITQNVIIGVVAGAKKRGRGNTFITFPDLCISLSFLLFLFFLLFHLLHVLPIFSPIVKLVNLPTK